MALIEGVGTPTESPDPFVRGLYAALTEDWAAARRILDSWRPSDPRNCALKYGLAQRVAFLSPCSPVVTGEMFDEVVAAGRALATPHQTGGVGLSLAENLVRRVKLGASRHRTADLNEARRLAVGVRDDRRKWRGDSAAPTAAACEAAAVAGDLRSVLRLGTTEGEATAEEARDPAVRKPVAVARLALGEGTASSLDLDGATAHDQALVRALVAASAGLDAQTHYGAALAAAQDDSERLVALAGLARSGAEELPGLNEIEARHPEVASQVRAEAALARGNAREAIDRLRGLAASSLLAAVTLAKAYEAEGEIDNAVRTAQEAAAAFAEPDLGLDAVRVLGRADRFEDASNAVSALLAEASPGWPGRTHALKIASDFAVQVGDLERAAVLLGASLEVDPDNARARWALVRLLGFRARIEAARRVLEEHPTELKATEPEEARTWLALHRDHPDTSLVARQALLLAQRFPDSEEVVADCVLITALLGTVDREPFDGDLLARVHRMQTAFFDRWPENPRARSVTFDDDHPEEALAKLQDLIPPNPNGARLLRRLQQQVARHELPVGALAAATGRSYAELLLTRATGTLPAWAPDAVEHLTSVKHANEGLGGEVVMDTTALVVLNLLPADLRSELLAAFRRVEVTDETVGDLRGARDHLSARPTASFGYDERAGQARFTETSEREAARLATEAKEVHELAASLPGRSAAPPDPNEPRLDRTYSPWLPTIRTAATADAVLWADDGALRQLARNTGASAFSTAALLEALVQQDRVADDDRQEALGGMIRHRVGVIPVSDSRFAQLAERDGWQATGTAFSLTDPAMWLTDAGFRLLDRVLPELATAAPGAVADWTFLAAVGVGYAHSGEGQARAMTGMLVALVIQSAKVTGVGVSRVLGRVSQD